MNKKLIVIICSILSVCVTWYINHTIGLGAIIANGLVGMIAVLLLPNDLAGPIYTSSFVGMSSMVVIPSFLASVLSGLIVGILIVLTPTIYAGIGGKGGTTAAISTIISRLIYGIIG